MQRALHMGDELHSRNTAAALLFLREIALDVIDMAGEDSAEVKQAIEALTADHYFFLRLSMAAAKATADAAHGIEGSSVVTAMGFSCREFAIRVSGLGDQWFTGPHAQVQAKLFEGHDESEITWMGGESPIVETIGLGGFAQAAAFPLQRYQGGSAEAMVERNLELYAITVGENSHYHIPYLGYRGSPTGIDLFRVLDTGGAARDGHRCGGQGRRADRRRYRACADGVLRACGRGVARALRRAVAAEHESSESPAVVRRARSGVPRPRGVRGVSLRRLEGLWSAELRADDCSSNIGVLVFRPRRVFGDFYEEGRIRGGDRSCVYHGTYVIENFGFICRRGRHPLSRADEERPVFPERRGHEARRNHRAGSGAEGDRVRGEGRARRGAQRASHPSRREVRTHPRSRTTRRAAATRSCSAGRIVARSSPDWPKSQSGITPRVGVRSVSERAAPDRTTATTVTYVATRRVRRTRVTPDNAGSVAASSSSSTSRCPPDSSVPWNSTPVSSPSNSGVPSSWTS